MQVTVVLSIEEIQSLVGLLDAGVRHTGLRGAGEADKLSKILDNAVKLAQGAPPIKETKNDLPSVAS